MPKQFDAIVIGAGQAGPSLAARLDKAGMRVAIAERKLFGGTCVNTGCIPTKAQIANARVAHLARRAAEFGVHFGGPVTVDMKEVKARREAIVQKSRSGIEAMLRKLEHCTVYQDHARFTGEHTVAVGNDVLQSERIFINVGARAAIPGMPGLSGAKYLTNSSLLDLDELPSHLIIIGGGPVGLEFAQMYRRFGSRVSIVEMKPRLAAREDEDVSDSIRQILENDGVEIHLESECVAVEQRGERVAVKMDCHDGRREVEGSHLLIAVGRRPNTDDLGLDAAGIAIDEHGYINVDDELRASVPGVWALGECNGRGAFTHTSYNDFEIVAANLLDNDPGGPRRVSDRISAYAVYIDPPLGRAGITEAEVRESGKDILMATRPMTKVSRAVEKGETQGFMKVLVDAETRRIVGAAVLGTGGDEVIHSLLDVMYAKAPYTVIQRAVHIHPTVSELIPTMLAGLKPLK